VEAGGNLQCTPPSHCCSRLMKTRRTLGVGQTPASGPAPFLNEPTSRGVAKWSVSFFVT
jgi:hypothetical protein